MERDLNNFFEFEFEIKIQRSRFIGHIEPCDSEQRAKEILKKIREKHNKATHNCWAYIIELNNYKIEHCSDNGEPPGTAGRPILGAIKRSGLVNVMLIVTRYFGGKKLGVRGLIDAYGLTAEKTINLKINKK